MIIVTGGAGFIGSAFVWRMNEEGIDDVLIVDVFEDPEKEKNLKKRKYQELLSRDAFLKMIVEDRLPMEVDAIVHMGACTSTTEMDVEFLTRNNFRYTQTLAEWAVWRGVRFIYASSAATYGNGSLGYSDDETKVKDLVPLNPYGRSKQQFDVWAIETKAIHRMVGLKFFNVYGPNEYHKEDMRSVIHKAFFQIQETGKMRLFKSHRPEYKDGEQKRDFIYVKDCVDVMWWLLHNPDVNGILNLGTGVARTWNALANAVYQAMGKQPKVEYFDMPKIIREKYQYFTQADMNKLFSADCPVRFHTLEDGVADYIENYLSVSDPYL